ncbi:MAG: lysine--tRNA ligase [Vampirovibrionales bacterium]|nr:lysine--tRNA ligase [Vampirovibrionales bacterium]
MSPSTEPPLQESRSESNLHGGDAIRAQRIAQLSDWAAKGLNPYPYRFDRTATAAHLQAHYAELANGVDTQDVVSVAGRIMAIRNAGLFLDLQDESGKIQAVCHKDYLTPGCLETLKWLDLGDIVGVTGIVRRTPRGELSIRVERYELLAKALLPLPEKYHGLNDLETRTRQRYLDLIVNAESRDRLKKRAQVVASIRQSLTQAGFLEVETPMLHPIAGGAAAKPFVTHHNALDTDLYLRIAPELYLKRLIAGGLSDKLFELNRCFRNEGISPKHNPEFTSVEIYQAYVDYTEMMTLTETLVSQAALAVTGAMRVPYGDIELDFTPPWPRKRMSDLIFEKTGVDFMTLDSDLAAREAAKKLGVDLDVSDARMSWGHCVAAAFEARVEAALIQPIHVMDLPQAISPLAKIKREQVQRNPQPVQLLVERFESFAFGWELANAFSELTDPLDQRARFEAQVAERAAGDAEAHPMDLDYINALEYGLPPTGGMAIGIDRLAMLLTNASHIRDVILFPTLRPKH